MSEITWNRYGDLYYARASVNLGGRTSKAVSLNNQWSIEDVTVFPYCSTVANEIGIMSTVNTYNAGEHIVVTIIY